MAFISSNQVVAENTSVAIGGHNLGDVTITTGLSDTQFETLQTQLKSISAQLDGASEVTQRDAIDNLLNSQIDEIAELIKQHKSITALDLLEKLYKRVAENASGKIRFRIKANIGICHHLNGDNDKAALFLLDAYDQAPSEPKAISNKVLALLFQGKSEDAFKFGKEHLTENSLNEALAGYLIQAVKAIPEVINPLEHVPVALQNTLSVLLGHVHFLMHRGKYGDWWGAAHKGAELYPESVEFKRYSAIADLEDIFNTLKTDNSFSTTLEQHLKLKQVAVVLNEVWTKSVSSEAGLLDEDKADFCNLANIFYFLRNVDGLRSLINQAVIKSKQDANFLIEIAQISFNTGQLDLAEKIISEIEHSENLAFLRFCIAHAKEDIQYLSEVKESIISTFPPLEISFSKLIVRFAQLRSMNESVSDKLFSELMKDSGKNIRELLVVAEEARRYGFIKSSENAYKKACKSITSKSHIIDRLMLGREAYYRSDWQTVITSLNGYISIYTHSDYLEYLAVAFANELPIQLNSISFFENLPHEIASIQKFKTLKGALFYNQGDLVKAQAELVSALESDCTDLNAFITLFHTYSRQNQEAEIEQLVSRVNQNEMIGNPVFKMQLAQLMKKYGRFSEAIEFGYRILSEYSNNQSVIPLYMGLLLFNDEKDNLIPSSNKVQKGYWIKLINQDGAQFEFIYDDNPISHIPNKDLKHPLVLASIGKSLGDTFKQDRRGFPPIIWTISEIKHKYIHALHSNMEQFETNFPESNALIMVKLPDSDDVSSILEIIKNHAEKTQDVLGNYLGKSIPLGVLAKYISRDCDVISAAEMLHNNKINIYTNSGAIAELEVAVTLLESNNFDIVVLDTYTSWHVAVSNLFPVLIKVFNKIIVPQSVLDELQLLVQFCDGVTSGESMSIGWRDGQYQRYIRSEDDNRIRLAYIKQQIDKIKQNCNIEVVSWAEKPNELISNVIEIAGAHFWDSANLALQPNRLLLSEDLFYRQWAGHALGLKNSLWIDAVLRYCYKLNLISINELTDAILHFSAWGHSHIILDTDILTSVLAMDETENLVKFQNICKYIGIKDADFPSHVLVVKRFLQLNFSTSENNKTKLKKATCLLLDQLFRYAPDKALSIIVLCFEAPSEMEECIIEWRELNGISDDEMVNAYRNIDHELITKESLTQ